MGIVSIYTDVAGQIGVYPRRVKLITSDSYSTITTAGYLNPASLEGYSILPTDILDVWYGYNSTLSPGTYGQFLSSISTSGVITLVATVNRNNVVANVQTVTAAELKSTGKVNIFVANSTTAQIAILDIKVMKSTGLSGGSGDRLLALTDGTLVFNNAGITAALLGTPIFTLWGSSGNPIASSSEATISTAGANVYLQYSGGTLDYTSGSVIIAVSYSQVGF